MSLTHNMMVAFNSQHNMKKKEKKSYGMVHIFLRTHIRNSCSITNLYNWYDQLKPEQDW